MADFWKPTNLLRYVEADGCMNEKTPFLQIPNYPECSPSYYKLQQQWRNIQTGKEDWRDIEIDYNYT